MQPGEDLIQRFLPDSRRAFLYFCIISFFLYFFFVSFFLSFFLYFFPFVSLPPSLSLSLFLSQMLQTLHALRLGPEVRSGKGPGQSAESLNLEP